MRKEEILKLLLRLKNNEPILEVEACNLADSGYIIAPQIITLDTGEAYFVLGCAFTSKAEKLLTDAV